MKGVVKMKLMEEMNNLYEYNPNHYCAIYARRSSQNDKDNIENQLQTCRDKADELNLIISEEYFDYESATKYEPFHRPGFKKLIYDLKNNKFKSIIVYKRDRLARKVIHFKEIKYLCEQNNVKIIYASADEAFLSEENTNKSLFPLIENILVSFAELEPENIKLRTKDGRDRKRASGNYPISSRYPKGYTKDGKSKNAKLIHDTKLAPIIIEIFKKLSKASLTKASIKSILNETNNKYNLQLKETDILKIIQTPIYAGRYTKAPNTPITKLLFYDEKGNLSLDESNNNLIGATNVTPLIKNFNSWKKVMLKYFDVNGFSDINSLDSSLSILSNLTYCGHCGSRVHLIGEYFECVDHCIKVKKEILLDKILSVVINDLFTEESLLIYYNNKMKKVQLEIEKIDEDLKTIYQKEDKLLLEMIRLKDTNDFTFNDLALKEKNLKDNYDKLKETMSEYIYYKENLYPKISLKEKNLLVQHFVLNENVANDFLKNIIKKVGISVSVSESDRRKFKLDFHYKCGGSLSKSIRQKTKHRNSEKKSN